MSYKVVIVGAGISGLSAARYLWKAGVCDVTILEAEERIGGRICSTDFHGIKIELGALYIHGTEGNAVYEVMQKQVDQFNEKRNGTDKYVPPKTSKVVRASGKEIGPFVFRMFQESGRIPDLLDEKILNIIRENGGKYPDSFKDTDCLTEAKKVWKDRIKDLENGEKLEENLKNAIFEKSVEQMNIIDGGPPDISNVYQYCIYKELEGYHLIFDDGYSVVPNYMASAFPSSVVKLNCKVRSIIWDGQNNQGHPEKKVEVKYANGNGESCTISADHVIVTASLGCLKKYHRDLFVPSLPAEKRISIENLGFGQIDKIYFYYENPFWTKEDFPLYVLWDTEEELDPSFKWVRLIQKICPYRENFLNCWFNGETAKDLEVLTNEEIKSGFTRFLRKFLKNSSIQEPDDIKRTNWSKNENINGSYMYFALGSTVEDVATMSSPLEVEGVPRVLFAGEATHESRYSTTDGAFQTGERQAKRILKFHQN